MRPICQGEVGASMSTAMRYRNNIQIQFEYLVKARLNISECSDKTEPMNPKRSQREMSGSYIFRYQPNLSLCYNYECVLRRNCISHFVLYRKSNSFKKVREPT